MGVRAVIAAAVTSGVLAACTQAPSPPRQGSATYQRPEGTSTLFHQLRDRQEINDRSYAGVPAHSFADLLPNQRFAIFGEHQGPRPLTSAVVVGRVTATRGGIGYYLKRPTSEGGTATAYDDPRSRWHTGIVTVAVDHGLGLRASPASIDFSVRIDAPDPDAFLAAVRRLGTVLVVLVDAGSRPRDSAAYLLMDEDLLADIDVNGRVYFPALGGRSSTFLHGLDTVDDVLTEAAKVKPVIKAAVIKGSIAY